MDAAEVLPYSSRLQMIFSWRLQTGRGSKPRSEHPNPTTKIGSKMGGEFNYPKMVPLVLTDSQLQPVRSDRRLRDHVVNEQHTLVAASMQP